MRVTPLLDLNYIHIASILRQVLSVCQYNLHPPYQVVTQASHSSTTVRGAGRRQAGSVSAGTSRPPTGTYRTKVIGSGRLGKPSTLQRTTAATRTLVVTHSLSHKARLDDTYNKSDLRILCRHRLSNYCAVY